MQYVILTLMMDALSPPHKLRVLPSEMASKSAETEVTPDQYEAQVTCQI